ncbi:MAG: hypothetical protein H0X02_02380 [Nitrosomonas sp.]|nr:hypothetical protein [Nitrosomonas sp.]
MLLIYHLLGIETKIDDEYDKAHFTILMWREYDSFMSYLLSDAWVTHKREFLAEIADF